MGRAIRAPDRPPASRFASDVRRAWQAASVARWDAKCHQRPVVGPNALEPEVLEATTGIEPVYTDLQSAA
jgi:hypothetical protein